MPWIAEFQVNQVGHSGQNRLYKQKKLTNFTLKIRTGREQIVAKVKDKNIQG